MQRKRSLSNMRSMAHLCIRPYNAIQLLLMAQIVNIQGFTINNSQMKASYHNYLQLRINESVQKSIIYSTSSLSSLLSLSSLTDSKSFEVDINDKTDGKGGNNPSKHWEIAPTLNKPYAKPLPSYLRQALETGTHPDESKMEHGNAEFVTEDWRKAWYTYKSPPENPDLICESTGEAEYEITDIDGILPDDLVGVLYRNGPGKFGLNEERVAHVLDSDGLVLKIHFMEKESDGKRKVMFRSKFVETKEFIEEREANQFLYRGTFGTAPYNELFSPPRRDGLNEDPPEISPLSKIAANAFKTDIKNAANTQVISFGGKLLTLFEAGLPYRLDPITLETIGEDDLDGALGNGSPVKLPLLPDEFVPDYLGGAAHTAHPKICPRTGNLVGWHWSQLPLSESLEVTFTEWDRNDFKQVAKSTYEIPNCELAPHDMALSDNYIVLHVNALSMNRLDFMSGLKGPAASLKMDGRANTKAWVFPRPTSHFNNVKKPFSIDVPPVFSIHFPHAYEDEENEKLVCMCSGWPPNDSKDFLGAWGGFAPVYDGIPATFLWRLEIPMNHSTNSGSTIDNNTKSNMVELSIAKGCANACVEFPVVHPNFRTRKTKYVYSTISNVVGDSSAPTGYARLNVEDGNEEELKLNIGQRNEEIDAFWLGTRVFAGEPLVIPKHDGDLERETDAYLLGMIFDATREKSAVAVFDLEKNLADGPVCTLWLKSGVPHGLHGCFAKDDNGSSSWFC